MPALKKIVLDVLKPHQPNPLDFANHLAARLANSSVHIKVVEIDDKTQTILATITGDALNFSDIEEAILAQGGSIHSIDEVLTVADPSNA